VTKRKLACEDVDELDAPSKLLRSSCESFDWKKDCFFCSQIITVDKKHYAKSKSEVRFAQTKSQLGTEICQSCAQILWSKLCYCF